MKNNDQIKIDLAHFTGTSQYFYHPLYRKFVYTEGVRYLAQGVGAYWLIEYIFARQNLGFPEGLQCWEVKLSKENNGATLEVTDGNDNQLDSFKVDYTDFPFDNFRLWMYNGVLMLPSEW